MYAMLQCVLVHVFLEQKGGVSHAPVNIGTLCLRVQYNTEMLASLHIPRLHVQLHGPD